MSGALLVSVFGMKSCTADGINDESRVLSDADMEPVKSY